jgi:hypothetical protein
MVKQKCETEHIMSLSTLKGPRNQPCGSQLKSQAHPRRSYKILATQHELTRQKSVDSATLQWRPPNPISTLVLAKQTVPPPTERSTVADLEAE